MDNVVMSTSQVKVVIELEEVLCTSDLFDSYAKLQMRSPLLSKIVSRHIPLYKNLIAAATDSNAINQISFNF